MGGASALNTSFKAFKVANGVVDDIGLLGFAKLLPKANMAWSSPSLHARAKALLHGADEVTVMSKSEAQELFLNLFNSKGFKNTTGMSTLDMKDKFMFPKGKAGTYHWDLFDTQHGGIPHLQIHNFDGAVIRIFFKK